jgi:DNA-binding winged helix-turn-helix (wHTH) protein
MAADVVKFGDGLELDRNSYELRRAGRALKLERIPLDILFLLVERRGQLVTREDIIGKIWGKDVFVDTDSSINGAIRKIRQVLKDDPENPVFVQTVTGKGYRFIAAVTEAEFPAHKSGGKNLESSNTIPQEPSTLLEPPRTTSRVDVLAMGRVAGSPAGRGSSRRHLWAPPARPVAVCSCRRPGHAGSATLRQPEQ